MDQHGAVPPGTRELWLERARHNIQVRLTDVASLSTGEARSFSFERYGTEEEGFILCVDGELYAYCNRCPHWNVDLDLGTRRFYDERVQAVICRNHGALFAFDTGVCRAGPCVGAGLERFEVVRDGADAVVEITCLELWFEGS